MEQSIIKDIRKLFTKSIMWTIIMTVLTIIVFTVLILLLQSNMIPANHAENKASDASEEMKNNPQKYLNNKAFSQKQEMLKEENVYLSEYSMSGRLISGPEKFKSLFKDKSTPDVLNTNISNNGYYHNIVPISDHNKIKGMWVYSYKLKATFANEYYRYILIGLLFLALLSPIIYFICFSKHYINKLYNSIKQPVDELIEASHKISQKDLEFKLNYTSKNEIGQLTNSFRKMQSELKKSLYENWRKDSEWAVMMSSLSHDLKTPATLIGLSTEVLNETGNLSHDQQSQIDIINRNIIKVNNILKSMSQSSNIKESIQIHDVAPIGDLIQDIESDMMPLMEEKSIQYKHDLIINNDLEVPYLKVNRILENIFSNAIQYTPENGKINFYVTRKSDHLHFAVEDSGPGIKKENSDLIFSKHFREDKSRSSSFGNAGLGLFNAKSLVEELNGFIESVDPLILTGTRIEFNIPYT